MFFVRADGNASVGAGHLMRCLSVAGEVKKRQEVLVLCGDGDSAALAREQGFLALVIGEEPFSEADACETCRFIAEYASAPDGPRPVILVDSYRAGDAYVERLSGCARPVCFDDTGETVYRHAWRVVNYNVFAGKEAYAALYGTEAGGPRILLGPDYVPLRPQFWEERPVDGAFVRNILITAGGGDEGNITGDILERLSGDGDLAELTYHVVCGPFCPNYGELARMAGERGNVFLHRNVENMARLMVSCGGAVTAAGTTVYELCALGVPFVCFSCAENQRPLADYMGRLESGMSAGHYPEDREGTLTRIAASVRRMSRQEGYGRRLSQAGRKLVDGRGAQRLADEFCGE